MNVRLWGMLLNAKLDACQICGVTYSFVSCPDPKRLNLISAIARVFKVVIKCYPCYKSFNQMIRSDVCMFYMEVELKSLSKLES